MFCHIKPSTKIAPDPARNQVSCESMAFIVRRICNNFEKNRALYDKSMKLGT